MEERDLLHLLSQQIHWKAIYWWIDSRSGEPEVKNRFFLLEFRNRDRTEAASSYVSHLYCEAEKFFSPFAKRATARSIPIVNQTVIIGWTGTNRSIGFLFQNSEVGIERLSIIFLIMPLGNWEAKLFDKLVLYCERNFVVDTDLICKLRILLLF